MIGRDVAYHREPPEAPTAKPTPLRIAIDRAEGPVPCTAGIRGLSGRRTGICSMRPPEAPKAVPPRSCKANAFFIPASPRWCSFRPRDPTTTRFLSPSISCDVLARGLGSSAFKIHTCSFSRTSILVGFALSSGPFYVASINIHWSCPRRILRTIYSSPCARDTSLIVPCGSRASMGVMHNHSLWFKPNWRPTAMVPANPPANPDRNLSSKAQAQSERSRTIGETTKPDALGDTEQDHPESEDKRLRPPSLQARRKIRSIISNSSVINRAVWSPSFRFAPVFDLGHAPREERSIRPRAMGVKVDRYPQPNCSACIHSAIAPPVAGSDR
ncbi:hypothetical protein DFH06DRAFT_1322555 [Mycena polygramma]|nr:hypothetical protein DFH06DRAFT_1322555 [Mycena polygramma]